MGVAFITSRLLASRVHCEAARNVSPHSVTVTVTFIDAYLNCLHLIPIHSVPHSIQF
jgi:hypothetical protein